MPRFLGNRLQWTFSSLARLPSWYNLPHRLPAGVSSLSDSEFRVEFYDNNSSLPWCPLDLQEELCVLFLPDNGDALFLDCSFSLP